MPDKKKFGGKSTTRKKIARKERWRLLWWGPNTHAKALGWLCPIYFSRQGENRKNFGEARERVCPCLLFYIIAPYVLLSLPPTMIEGRKWKHSLRPQYFFFTAPTTAVSKKSPYLWEEAETLSLFNAPTLYVCVCLLFSLKGCCLFRFLSLSYVWGYNHRHSLL